MPGPPRRRKYKNGDRRSIYGVNHIYYLGMWLRPYLVPKEVKYKEWGAASKATPIKYKLKARY